MAEDVKIGIKTTADTSGAEAAEKSLEKVKQKAQEVSREGRKAADNAKNGFSQAGASIGGATAAVGKLKAALSGFGAVAMFMGLVASIEKVVASFGKAAKEAEKLKAETEAATRKEAIDDLARSYDKLTASIADSAAKAEHANDILNMQVKNARDLEDANDRLEEQNELSAVDDADPLAAERRAEIKARHQARRSKTQASRAVEDVVYARQAERMKADRLNGEADKIEASLGSDRELLESLRSKRAAAAAESVMENGEDHTGFWGMFGANMKRIVSLDWGSVGDTRSEAGDEVRRAADARMKELDAQIEKVEGGIEAKTGQAKARRDEATRARDKADAYSISAAQVNQQATALEADSSVSRARGVTDAKAAKIARDEETIKTGTARIEQLQNQIAATKAAQSDASAAHDRERLDVFNAQNALDVFNAQNAGRGGSSVRGRRAELVADLARETEEAQASEVELKRTMNALSTTLQNLNKQLAEVNSKVNQAVSRQNAATDAAPAGE